MHALAAALASVALAAAIPPAASRDVAWVVGPAAVVLHGGRVRFPLPEGVALAAGESARAILDVVADGAEGEKLAVLSPVADANRWFVVVAWEAGAADPGRRWTVVGAEGDARVVNEHVRIPAPGGAVRVTLVTPERELAEARRVLDRIVGGLEATDSDSAPASARAQR